MLKFYMFAVLVGAAIAKDSYVIVAPTTIRPGMDFEVSANILKASGTVNVKATLFDGKQSVTSANGVLEQGQPQSLTLKVPKALASGTYKLKVSGSGGLTFNNETTIKYSSKSMSIFIQTDKAMYKPGQTVNFRVFAVYPDMKPYTGTYNIDIYDPNSIKIKQWIDVKEKTAVITNFLSITSQPVLGDWKIKITADRSYEEKTFTVDEYVLPTFEVRVDLPSYSLASDSDIKATIKAKYPCGIPVKGTVKLVARQEHYYAPDNYKGKEPMVQMEFNIDGKSTATISLAEMKRVFTHGLDYRTIVVVANVTEGLTNITLSGTNRVQIYSHATRLSFSPADPFKPGLKYIAYLQVQQQDGQPVQLSTKKVKVSTRVTSETKQVTTPFDYRHPTSYNLADETYSVPATGVVPVEIHLPSNASSISLTVKYDQVTYYKTISKSCSPSNNYIQLLLKSQHLASGNNVSFHIKATEAVGKLVYQVMSRGTIAATGTTDGNKKQSFSFNIPVTSKMAPNARIIVYYVRQDGEIVTDSVSFDVEGAFENQVSISVDKTSARPGENVSIEVMADPQSLVNLLAVEQSVFLPTSGNDITQGEVIEELKSYNTLTSGGSFYPMAYPTYCGGSDAYQVFVDAGVVVLTDALISNYVNPFSMAGGVEPGGIEDAIPSDFHETWLWTNHTIGVDGKAIISATVPDTITSWVASAFALNTKSGLGVSPTTAKIRVFRPFFVSLNLPYSVTRGEQIALQAIVFNNLTQDVDAVVTLRQSKEFDNVIVDSNGHETTGSKDTYQTVHIKSGGATTVFFPIVPKSLGKADISVSARSTLAADTVQRQLLVEPDGTPMEYNVPVLVDLKQVKTFSKQAQISLPPNIVPGSLKARVTAIGDLMGPSLSDLASLLGMPTGGGEETMVGLAPYVFITNYLMAANQLSADDEINALTYITAGYVRELKYQHKDGSFSAFVDEDPSGSVWLTAFVVKTFHQAKPYIVVDEDVMARGINWMLSTQSSDGQFTEPGRVFNVEMTGGSGKGAALTAFCLIALLENDDLKGGIQQKIAKATTKAVRYLETHTPADDYTLAIATYALQLAGSRTADTYLKLLDSHAIVKDGFKYWHRPEVKTTQSHQYWRSPNSKKAVDIEMAAYALLVYHEKNDFTGGLDIMKWIISQRNPDGGFFSTQDTVLALQALSKYAKIAYANKFDLHVEVTAAGFSHHFSISERNALVLQSVELPSVPRSIQVSATGEGIALVEVAVSFSVNADVEEPILSVNADVEEPFFNVNADVEEPTFDLTWQLIEEGINAMTFEICASWLGDGTSGKAIIEVGLLSGFDVDLDTITKVKTLKKIETPNKKVVLYFDEIGKSKLCMTFNLLRTGLVTKSQPVPIKVYSSSEPTNQKTIFYESDVLKKSDIRSVCADCENREKKYC